MNTIPFEFPPFRKRFIRRHCRIAATATYFPDRIVPNQAIIDTNQLPITDVAVRKTLGVKQRRVASQGMVDSDLLVEAARRCLAQAQVEADQVSKILVTKFLGDRILPMTAALVQRKLNCRTSMHAVDLEGGINAFLYALDLATRYISTTAEETQHILILSGGIHTLPVSKTDPRLAFLFGDGAAAVLLSVSADQHFLASYAYTNYEHFAFAGSRTLKMDQTISERIYERGEHHLLYNLYQMGNWKESIEFYLRAAQVTRDRLLEESGLTMGDIHLVLVTENNKRIRDLTLEQLLVPQEHSLSVIAEYGNTMSAMLPVLIHKAFDDNRVKAGMHLMLISHGEGASGGGMIYRV